MSDDQSEPTPAESGDDSVVARSKRLLDQAGSRIKDLFAPPPLDDGTTSGAAIKRQLDDRARDLQPSSGVLPDPHKLTIHPKRNSAADFDGPPSGDAPDGRRGAAGSQPVSDDHERDINQAGPATLLPVQTMPNVSKDKVRQRPEADRPPVALAVPKFRPTFDPSIDPPLALGRLIPGATPILKPSLQPFPGSRARPLGGVPATPTAPAGPAPMAAAPAKSNTEASPAPTGPMPRPAPAGAGRIRRGPPPVTGDPNHSALDLIRRHEGTGYNDTFNYDHFLPGGIHRNLSAMTLDEIHGMQLQMLANELNSTTRMPGGKPWRSSAAGAYQINRDTLIDLRRMMHLTGQEVFDEAMQDRMAQRLIQQKGEKSSRRWQSLWPADRAAQFGELFRTGQIRSLRDRTPSAPAPPEAPLPVLPRAEQPPGNPAIAPATPAEADAPRRGAARQSQPQRNSSSIGDEVSGAAVARRIASETQETDGAGPEVAANVHHLGKIAGQNGRAKRDDATIVEPMISYPAVKAVDKGIAASDVLSARTRGQRGLGMTETGQAIEGRLDDLKQRHMLLSKQCVALANAWSGDAASVRTWQKGDSAALGTLKPGTPIATFLDGNGDESPQYAGGGIGTAGAHRDHVGIFENYIVDRAGTIIGMKIAEQYDNQRQHLKHVLSREYYFNDRKDESNASLYHVILNAEGQPLGHGNPISVPGHLSTDELIRIRPTPPVPPVSRRKDKVVDLGRDVPLTPHAMLARAGGSSSPRPVHVAAIHVHSPAADPHEVAAAVDRRIAEVHGRDHYDVAFT